MKKQYVRLTPADRETLETLIRKGQLSGKTYRRALVLLELDQGQTYTAVSKTWQVSMLTLSTWTAFIRGKLVYGVIIYPIEILLEMQPNGLHYWRRVGGGQSLGARETRSEENA